MFRRITAAVAASAILVPSAAQAVSDRTPMAIDDSAELLDSTSAWVIAATLAGLGVLLLLLDSENEDAVPVSP